MTRSMAVQSTRIGTFVLRTMLLDNTEKSAEFQYALIDGFKNSSSNVVIANMLLSDMV